MKENLFCAPGKHWWDRDVSRGRKPVACPVHSDAHVSVAPDPDSEDDPVFTEEELAQDVAMAAMGIPDPSFAELKRHLEKSGPVGIIESARHLPATQYKRLASMCKDSKPVRGGRWA